MDKYIKPGMNIIIGDFTLSSESNGERVRSIINAINTLTEHKQEKLIIPLQYGFQRIEYHITRDQPDTIIILPVRVLNKVISDTTSELLMEAVQLAVDNDTDKTIVLCFDTDPEDDTIVRDKIHELSKVYTA